MDVNIDDIVQSTYGLPVGSPSIYLILGLLCDLGARLNSLPRATREQSILYDVVVKGGTLIAKLEHIA